MILVVIDLLKKDPEDDGVMFPEPFTGGIRRDVFVDMYPEFEQESISDEELKGMKDRSTDMWVKILDAWKNKGYFD